MRPLYETEADRIRERHTLERFCSAWGCWAAQMPQLARFDAILFVGPSPVAYAEVKVRQARFKTYGSMYLSLDKWHLLCEKAKKRPALLLTQWNDGMYWLSASPDKHPTVVMFGRLDRGDPRDVQPHVVLPMSWFRRIDVDQKEVRPAGRVASAAMH